MELVSRTMKNDNGKLDVIQHLRAVAALMVVIHHARNSMPRLVFNPLEGYPAFARGVDIFFVISGFIMYVAARDEHCVDFARKRIIRVVPLYWGATLALVVIATKFHPWSMASSDFLHVAKSLLFIPHYSPTQPDEIWPFLIPGWTLNYEMFFYAVFFIGLLIKAPLLITSILIIGLIFLGYFLEPSGAVLRTYTSPIMFEFLFGVWIGYLYANNILLGHAKRLLIVGFCGLFCLPLFAEGGVRIAGKISCSAMIVLGAVSLQKNASRNSLFSLLGDASYSIFLTHMVISLPVAYKLWNRTPVHGWWQFVAWISLSLLVSAVLGIFFYRYFEKPMLKWLQKKWKSPVRTRSDGVRQVAPANGPSLPR